MSCSLPSMASKRNTSFGIALVGCLIAACASETVDPASYDQACVVDDDCTVAWKLERSGGTCSSSCPAPISRAGRAKYDADAAGVKSSCSDYNDSDCTVDGAPGCKAGRCAFVACSGVPCVPLRDGGH